MLRTLSRRPRIPGIMPDPSLVLWLPLYQQDGATFTSQDAYGHACTVTGALWTPRGRSFDGTDDYVNLGVSAALNPASALSLQVWFYVAGGAGTSRVVIGRWDTAGGVDERTYILEIFTDNKLYFRTTRDGTADTMVSVASIDTIPLNVWHHAAGVWDGATNLLYLNAQLQNSSAQASIKTSPNTRTAIGGIIGRVGDPVASFFRGEIALISGFSRGVTATEISRIYALGKGYYR